MRQFSEFNLILKRKTRTSEGNAEIFVWKHPFEQAQYILGPVGGVVAFSFLLFCVKFLEEVCNVLLK